MVCSADLKLPCSTASLQHVPHKSACSAGLLFMPPADCTNLSLVLHKGSGVPVLCQICWSSSTLFLSL